MIEIRNITKTFSGVTVLEDISASFEKGKTNLIIGQSGSGKTVLIKCIVGLHEIDKGEIIYDNRVFSKMDFKKRKALRKEVGMVFQGSALFDSATVEQNVIYPLDMFTSMSDEEKRERANFCLKRVNIVNCNHLYPAEISGGMKKRVAIARAIVLNPKYLFFDEPDSGLDPITTIVINNLIKEITEEFETTTIVSTHDMNTVMSLGETILFLYKGRKCWEGTKNDIFHSNNKEFDNFIFASNSFRKLKETINKK